MQNRGWDCLIGLTTQISAFKEVQLLSSDFQVVGRKRHRSEVLLYLLLWTNTQYGLSAVCLRRSRPLLCPSATQPTKLWHHEGRLVNLRKADYTGRQNGGDVGLAQPSMDYDVDSNPEGWTERLRLRDCTSSGLWPGICVTGSRRFCMYQASNALWALSDLCWWCVRSEKYILIIVSSSAFFFLIL